MIKIGYCLFGSFLILGEQMAPLSSHEAERWYGEKNQKKPYALKKKMLLKRLPSTLASLVPDAVPSSSKTKTLR